MTITEEVTKKYNHSFDKNFIDSRFNLPEYYEEYVVKNIKVIKNIQFFFQQSEYENAYDKIKADLQIEFDYSKNYLFFDLDETLIHSESFDEARKSLYDKVISIVSTNEDGKEETENYGIFVRPKVDDFLKWVSQHFTLVIFTAAEKNYAEKVLKEVGIFQYFESILDRTSTINVKGFMIKDMSIFNSRYEKLNALIIDNNIYSFSNSLKQGVLISSFYDDKTDDELTELRNYIEKHLLEDITNLVSVNDSYYMYHELMSNIDEEANIEAN
jgi:TFIIF-interacting CTD phosphatase-like protein